MTDNQKQKRNNSLIEAKDFSMVLALLPALTNEYKYKGLDKLFSIIGIDRLILLCKYLGGQTIKIPTLNQLTLIITSLQWYLDVYVLKTKEEYEIPQDERIRSNIKDIKEEMDSQLS